MAYGTVNADVIGTSVAGSNLGAGNASLLKNRLINGAMVIDQRNAGASVTQTTANLYGVDRFQAVGSVTSKFTFQQSSTAPTGFNNSTLITSSAATSVGASDFYIFGQFIEGYNIADLGWGTVNAKTVTLSFWVQSSLIGTFGGSIQNSDNSRNYPFSYSIPVANTWTQISITVAGDTTGTWNTTNGTGMKVRCSMGSGSTVSGTAGSWSGTLYYSATGATSVVGTNGATFYITGVQLEVGSSATGFEYRQYGQELALCQRYYIKYSGNGYRFYGGRTESTANYVWSCPLPVEMRTVPTVSAIDVTNLQINDGSVQVACTSISTAYSSIRQITQAFNCGTVTSLRYGFIVPTSATAAVEASAEL